MKQRKERKEIMDHKASTRDLRDSVRWNISHILRVPEEEEWEKGAEGFFEQLIAESFSHEGKETGIQVLAAQRIHFQVNKTRSTPRHVKRNRKNTRIRREFWKQLGTNES